MDIGLSPAPRADAGVFARRRRITRLREAGFGYVLVLPVFLFLLLLILWPAVGVVWDSLTAAPAHGRGGTLNLSLYMSILSNPISRHDIIFTLIITVLAVAILLPLCYGLALYLHFSRSPWVFWYRFLCILPLFIPTIILAFAFIVFFQNQGMLDGLLSVLGIEKLLHLSYSEPINDPQGIGIILGSIWKSIPITVLLLGAGLRDIDRSLIEAARDVGAGAWPIFSRIVVPLTLRQALIALALSFIGILGSFTIPYLLGPTAPQMLGPLLQATFADYREPLQADALAVISFLLAALVGVAYVIAVARRASSAASGEGG